ncbi:MAG: rRNA adenine N-6-methyltransferase family protein, partial [Spirochaetales bacterium]
MIYQNINYNSPTMLKAFLEFHNMAMQKKFGQNFLVNEHARKKLTDALELSSGTRVWEIGPGLGALTQCVLQRGAKLTAFEIDRGFSAILTDIFKDEILAEQFTLIQGNVLKTWKAESEKFVPERLCGNLPYNIAAVLIADMISASVRFERAVLTVQKEVAVRMSAKPKTADYSSFSVLC